MGKAFILCQLVEGMSNETGLSFLSTHSSITTEGPVCTLYWAAHQESQAERDLVPAPRKFIVSTITSKTVCFLKVK